MVLEGHSEVVESVTWSPTGLLASVCRLGCVNIWDAVSGKLVVSYDDLVDMEAFEGSSESYESGSDGSGTARSAAHSHADSSSADGTGPSPPAHHNNGSEEQPAPPQAGQDQLELHKMLLGQIAVEPSSFHSILASNPHSAKQRDQFGRLPLTMALRTEAAPGVVRMILEAYPDAASEAETPSGALPIHVSASYQHAAEVLPDLLRAHPAGATSCGPGGMLPLHIASRVHHQSEQVVSMLLLAGPEAAHRPDDRGQLPIDIALEAGAAPQVIRTLLRAGPAASILPLLHMSSLADAIGGAVASRPELAYVETPSNVPALEAACLEVRRAIETALCFLGRYRLDEGGPAHRSATCVVVFAEDVSQSAAPPGGDGTEGEAGSSSSGSTRVALKLMGDLDQFVRELTTRSKHRLQKEFVVGILRAHIEAELLETTAAKLDAVTAAEIPLLAAAEVGGGLRGPWTDGMPDLRGYKYCIALEFGNRNLSDAVVHDRLSEDWHRVQTVAVDVARSLRHLHARAVIHGDLKPLNLVRVGERWQLIDLDVACTAGGTFGSKSPSTAYCPPELACLLVRGGSLQDYVAGVEHDMWGFGALLYELSSVRNVSLWHAAPDGHMANARDLEDLALWNAQFCYAKMEHCNPGFHGLEDLMVKLLEADPVKRLSNFGGRGMTGVLQHPCFAKSGNNTELAGRMEEVSVAVKRQASLLARQHSLLQGVDAKVDHVLRKLNQQSSLLSSILMNTDMSLPGTICIVPASTAESLQDMRWGATPANWFKVRVRLFFVDPVSFTVAATNGGEGFQLSFQRAWVTKCLPYLRVALTAFQVASAAGRVAGFPIPDFAALAKGWVAAQLDAVASLAGEAEFPEEALTALESYIASATASVAKAPVHLPLGDSAKEALQSASTALYDTLQQVDPDWKTKTGLERTVSQTGEVEWVLPEHARQFRLRGCQVLGHESTVQNDVLHQLESQLREQQAALELKDAQLQSLQWVPPHDVIRPDEAGASWEVDPRSATPVQSSVVASSRPLITHDDDSVAAELRAVRLDIQHLAQQIHGARHCMGCILS